MIGASIRFSVNMADPDLAEMAKKVPAVIEQSRVGVIDRFWQCVILHNVLVCELGCMDPDNGIGTSVSTISHFLRL